MKISKVGINLIKEFEGCQLKAYKCPAGVWTIGIGHTGTVDGKQICVGMTITQEKAEQLLRECLEKRYEPPVRKFSGLNQNQYDALVSFCYNLGPGIFKGNLLNAINAKDWNDVAIQIRLYNKARVNGVLTELKGLTRRRDAEAELFLKPVIEDEELKKAVTKIIDSGVQINDASWNRLDRINLKNVPALLNKLGGIDSLVEGKVISNDGVWRSGNYTKENVRSLLIKYASKVG
ncbi:lysozyme [Niameybacter massiliensis]|uniref:Lysozyme n=1 Tax=Holtiella tumoricola TaxID=3018743 RepID=A0AA42J0H0_9FIRM|nr:lysozyme [Holtiella tumoricola]MDA3731420.1 lysozyme [Holtiella tumoricola]